MILSVEQHDLFVFLVAGTTKLSGERIIVALCLLAFGQFVEQALRLMAATAVEAGAEYRDDFDHILRQFLLEGRRLAFVDDDDSRPVFIARWIVNWFFAGQPRRPG